MRPRWQVVAFGAGAVLTLWLPLQVLAQAIVRRLIGLRLGDVPAVPPGTSSSTEGARLAWTVWAASTLALAVAAGIGGYVLGRWIEQAGTRDGAIAGALVAGAAVILAWVTGGVSAGAWVAVVVAAPAAALGARVGRRARGGGLA